MPPNKDKVGGVSVSNGTDITTNNNNTEPGIEQEVTPTLDTPPEEGKPKEAAGTKEMMVGDLLEVKLSGGKWTEEEIEFLVEKITDYSLDDVQLGTMLAAVKVRGMEREEVVALTRCMRDSGQVLSWPGEWRMMDKHSTGGVGDKVSLPLAPALAALGLHVPMISGRGLGHTGGTLDKLESIPGYRVPLTQQEMAAALREAGCCIVGQTADITPADRRMYAARDVTSTVNSLPLIVSSILSKKAAAGVDTLVLDIKFGRSAFMQTLDEARELAEAMVGVSAGLGLTTVALATEMSSPIGRSVGNALEVIEALECLRGAGPADLRELVVHLGGELVVAAGLAVDAEGGRRAVERALDDGSALAAFRKMIQMQGVSAELATALCGPNPDYSVLPRAAHTTPLHARTAGVVSSIDGMALAYVSLSLGAGRKRSSDPINHAVGVMLKKCVGERVGVGEAWAELHHDKPLSKALVSQAQNALVLDENGEVFPAPSRIAARFS